jgi:hypothetical protein
MGAKIWWRWIKTPTEIWAQLWKHKYAPDIQHSHWIRMQDKLQGSNIWNVAWRNIPLIQEHAFWEINNGQTARFWTDSWQQLPPLQSDETLLHYENHIQNLATAKVADMWVANPNNHSWRTWKSMHPQISSPSHSYLYFFRTCYPPISHKENMKYLENLTLAWPQPRQEMVFSQLGKSLQTRSPRGSWPQRPLQDQ